MLTLTVRDITGGEAMNFSKLVKDYVDELVGKSRGSCLIAAGITSFPGPSGPRTGLLRWRQWGIEAAFPKGDSRPRRVPAHLS